MDLWDTLGSLKMSQPQRDTLETLKVLWTHGTHWGPKKRHSHKGRAGDPKGHRGDLKGHWGPKAHVGDPKRRVEDPKGVTAPRDTLGTLKVLWTHGTHWGPKAMCWGP